MTLLDKGIVLPQKIAAAIGMEYKDMQRQLDEARINNWTENLTPILTAYTATGQDVKGGAPKKKSSEISDSGIAKRDSGNGGED